MRGETKQMYFMNPPHQTIFAVVKVLFAQHVKKHFASPLSSVAVRSPSLNARLQFFVLFFFFCRWRSKQETIVRAQESQEWFLFNFASREKFIVTILRNMMPLFAFLYEQSQPRAEQSLHQILKTKAR